ncbi:MAG: 2-C-methyl-D-erythritol 4-phosphate cytidylyltransferase [Deltaproteobacteria bacterium]|nr:2-C-methyl-D-erythritol 4-phosphate cytidylyltransferase [Deltaproteobacteria bacterium]
MKVAAIIPAAGTGQRMQQHIPKQYLSFGGKPILAHTLTVLENLPEIAEITVVAQPSALDFCQTQVITPFGFKKVLRLVPGGKERQDSVYNALKVLQRQNEWDLILVHDGVRPFVTPAEVLRVIRAAGEHGAAILALPAQDTVKKVNRAGRIKKTLNRQDIWLAQTPQVFQTAIIWRAFLEAYAREYYGTDEASLVEALGLPVRVEPGSPFNIKVTTPEDLILAEAIYRLRQQG